MTVDSVIGSLPLGKMLQLFAGVPVHCAVPELLGLTLPDVGPGEVSGEPYQWDPRQIGFDLNSRPLDGSDIEQSVQMEALRDDPDNHRTAVFYRSGTRIVVDTSFVGMNVRTSFDGPALAWETMVFIGLSLQGEWQARYQTKAAALAGHAVVVTAIRQEQRRRRESWRTLAPRRGKGKAA